MKEWLIIGSEYSIVIIDAIALLTIILGTLHTVFRVLAALSRSAIRDEKRDIWLRYARVLVGALTFQLAADIIESAISTSWESIARLAAIAVIRTFINYFLERDMADVRERQHKVAAEAA